MALLFSSKNIGALEIPNRFVCSATYEGLALETGEVSEALIKRYARLAKGGVGLAITGLMHVHPSGRGYRNQTGIHADRMIDGLEKLTTAVHQAGGRIAFQLAHCGRQTTRAMAGQTPLAPSRRGRDPINFVKPKEMSAKQISETIKAFGAAAKRAVDAGADAIQLHGAHGYLISEFLSPFFNTRKDAWGGSDKNRFRFVEEVFQEIKARVPDNFPILIKINASDFTPGKGITPSLAARYAGWLAGIGLDAVELSCGTSNYSYMNMCRGDVPTAELVQGLPWWKKPVGRLMIGKLEGQYLLQEGYNREAAEQIKPALGDVPLIVVGGMRTVSRMEAIVENGVADFISMSRPFIREPFLVNKIKDGTLDQVSCVSCNRCLAAIPNEFPVYCYHRGFPSRSRPDASTVKNTFQEIP